jgi:predicted dehydrogenase
MIDTCRERNIKLSINHGRRWSPAHLQLRKLLREGIIGDIRGITCSLGGGRLGCNGSHMLDLMRMYAESEPRWVIGFIDQTGTPNPRGKGFKDPGGYGQIHFQNDVRCYLDMSEDLGIPVRFEIIGSMGRVTVDEDMNRWDIIARSREDRQAPLTNYGLPLKPYPFDSYPLIDSVAQTKEAIKELCEDKSPGCSGEDGKAALEMVMAFHVSHKQGNVKVDIPLKGEHLSYELQIT